MDVDPFVEADAEPSKLIEPGEGAFDNQTHAAQAAPVRGAAHGQ